MRRWLWIPAALLLVGIPGTILFASPPVSEETPLAAQEEASPDAGLPESLREALETLELELSKLPLCEEPELLEDCLFEAAMQSRMAAAHLAQLDTAADRREDALSFLQRLSELCRSLQKSIREGKPPNDAQMELLSQSRNACLALVQGTSAPVPDLPTASDGDKVYPVMIYDGPFSEGEQATPAVGLTGPEGTRDEARRIAAQLLQVEVDEVTDEGEEFGDMAGWIFSHEDRRVMLAKRGLKPVWLLGDGDAGSAQISPEEALQKVLSFLRPWGIEADTLTWQEVYDGYAVFCLAPTQEGVILYPDLVKVKVSLKDGSVLSLDARRYWHSHRERELPAPKLDEAQARLLAPRALSAHSLQLAWIEPEGGSGALCWEVRGTLGEDRFYVFIDSIQGKTLDIFREVAASQGAD